MELLVNDLSFHGQFPDLSSFEPAIQQLMKIRQIAHRFERELHCHRGVASAQVTPTMTMPQAVRMLTLDQRRALLQWLTQHGPFWEDTRKHGLDDWIECNGGIVTDTAVGEAAWCCLNGIERGLVSLAPSDWQFSPVPVDLKSETSRTVEVFNYWDPATIEAVLESARSPLVSWDQLKTLATLQWTQLTFAADTFTPLNGGPFNSGAAQRLEVILRTLNRFKSCFDSAGRRTAEGHQIYQDFFTGRTGQGGHGAMFSDSSNGEKREFEKEMTFRHPAEARQTLFCTWHGKVQTPQLRVHFSWPVRANEPLFVVYVGPKITKR